MESFTFYELLARKISGEANSEEISMLEKHLQQHPEDRPAAEAFAQLYQRKNSSSRIFIPPVDKAWERHLERLRASEQDEPAHQPSASVQLNSPGRSRQIWMAAASLVFILTSVLFFQWYSKQPLTTDDLDEWLTYEAGNRRVRLTLKDGTLVWLNKNSRIVYNRDFGKKKRDLTLIGEAFFDVHHDPRVRMVVHARNIDITVKGTAFNVMAYPSDQTVETSLIRGSVELSTQSDRQMTIFLKPNEKISIPVVEETTLPRETAKPEKSKKMESQEILYSIHRLQEEQQSKLIPEIAWIEDRLVFQSESFQELAEKLERFYGVTVEITDPALAVKRFTGSFCRESLEEALNALQLTSHFSYRISGNNVTILTPQPATQ